MQGATESAPLQTQITALIERIAALEALEGAPRRPDHEFEFRNNTGTADIVDTYDSSIDAVMSGEATCSIDAQGNYGLIINTNDPSNCCDFTWWNYGRASGDTGQMTVET